MIYWINMKKCINRKDFMTKQFSKFKLGNTRIEAIIPKTLPKILPHRKYPYIKQEEYSCLCSHLLALETGLKNKDPYFTVMEDDTVIPYHLNIDKLIESAPNDWEILQLYISNYSEVNNLYEDYKNGVLWKPHKIDYFSTGVYIIKQSAAKKIIDKVYSGGTLDLSSQRWSPLADSLLYRLVKTYSCTYPLYYSNISLESEIHKTHLIRHEKANILIQQIQKNADNKPEFI